VSDRPEFFTPWWQARLDTLRDTFTRDACTPPEQFFSTFHEVSSMGLTTENEAAVDAEVARWGAMVVPPGHPHPITALHHAAILSALLAPSVSSVIEFGGGFGSMAHIAHHSAPQVEWTIIDAEVMLDLQAVYLRGHGIDAVSPGEGRSRTAVNLCSHADADRLRHRADVFIGTWSVSEATTECHRWLINRHWFGASTVFLAVDESKPEEFGDGCALVAHLRDRHGFTVTPSPFAGSVYVTRGFDW
jgi:hypothetical protein